MGKTHLSVVIPAYNEESRIENCINTIEAYFKADGFSVEIIVVNDGSVDRTAIIVKYLAAKYKNLKLIDNTENKGKGYAVKCGMLAASKEFVLFTDADLSTPIQEIEKAIGFLKQGYDIVIGSRRIKGSNIKVYQPLIRRIFGYTFHTLRRIMFLWYIHDSQCGFKVFKKAVVKDIFSRLTIDGFSFDVEALLIAYYMKLKIKEMPVVWIDDMKTTLSVGGNIKKVAAELIRIFINRNKGVYK